MSTIGVTYHEEDIRNIIKKPTPPIEKTPMYKSKREKQTEAKSHGRHQTFGLAHYRPPDCSNFLKKGTGHKPPSAAVEKKKFVCTSNCNLPRIPKWKIECPKRSGKNFVKENIKWVTSLEPKIPAPRSVVSPRGTVKDLGHLIQMIKVRESEAYGRVPGYLCERKKKMDEYHKRKMKREEIEKSYREQMGIGTRGMSESVYMVDQETRQKLLQGLKEHWNELSKQFLKLPVMCDTMTKIKRKVWLENEIDRVEKDVKLVESHPYIYLERTDNRRTDEIAEEILRQQEEMEKKVTEEKMNKEKETGQEMAEAKDDEEVRVLDYDKEKDAIK